MKSVGLISVAVLLVLGLVFGFYYISVRNQEVKKFRFVESVQDNISNVHAGMWAIIKGQAQVSEKYQAGFDSIYTHMMEGRYQKGDGSLMKWITESNPQFDVSLYSKLSESIEVQRSLLREEQTRLLDAVRDYNTFISGIPNNIILSDKVPLKAKIITSTRSKEAVNTGVDDDLSIF